MHAKAAALALPLVLVLCHGWPDSSWRYSKVIPRLTDPGSHGADPADAFDVVVPDMPGYGYSDRPTGPPMDVIAVAGLWAELMSVLGYARFGAAGRHPGLRSRQATDDKQEHNGQNTTTAPLKRLIKSL